MSLRTSSAVPVNRRRNDLLLIAGILAAVAVFAILFFATRREGSFVAVIQQGREIARYSLAEEQEIPIQTDGTVTHLLVIREGTAEIQQADCPDQICVHHRPVSKVGETVVCLPRELVIKIVNEKTAHGPDLVV